MKTARLAYCAVILLPLACSASSGDPGSNIRNILGDYGGSDPGSGGASASGGSSSLGGSSALGGAPSSGGFTAVGGTGGASAGGTGGASTGGTGGVASGGSSGMPAGGTTATGGANAAGGSGGADASGGSGGAESSGGTGGAAAGGTGGVATGGTGGSAAGGTGGAATGGTGGGSSPANGLIGYWPLDEMNGTMAMDAAGSNHLTATGCATLGQAGKVGRAARFGNGNPLLNDCSGRLSRANVNYGSLSGITVSFWFKNEFMGGSAPFEALFVEVDGRFSVYADDEFLWWVAGAMSESTMTRPAGSSWMHIAATWQAQGGAMVFYLNGQAVNTVTGPTSARAVMGMLSIAHDGTVDHLGFSGYLDEVRLYNRALSLAEVQALAAQ